MNNDRRKALNEEPVIAPHTPRERAADHLVIALGSIGAARATLIENGLLDDDLSRATDSARIRLDRIIERLLDAQRVEDRIDAMINAGTCRCTPAPTKETPS